MDDATASPELDGLSDDPAALKALLRAARSEKDDLAEEVAPRTPPRQPRIRARPAPTPSAGTLPGSRPDKLTLDIGDGAAWALGAFALDGRGEPIGVDLEIAFAPWKPGSPERLPSPSGPAPSAN